jgi:hypothetical protein
MTPPDTRILRSAQAGPQPGRTPATPHLQQDQPGPRQAWTGLASRIFALAGVKRPRRQPRSRPTRRSTYEPRRGAGKGEGDG